MDQQNETVIVTKASFEAVGMKWEGTFAEAGAGAIRAIQMELRSRVADIKHVVHPEILLGLSYHITGDRFTHYAVMEVDRVENLPEEMTSLTLPDLTYAKSEHRKDQNIEASYTNIFTWIAKQGYPLETDHVTHFEQYPMDQDPYSKDPEFIIMIPIGQKEVE